MKCGQCLQDSPPGAGFCTECGAKLVERCRKCGTLNTNDVKFCMKCGYSQPVVERAAVLVTRTPSPFAEPSHLCPSCGSTSVETALTVGRFQRALMSLIGRKLYVCRDCSRRFFDLSSDDPRARRRRQRRPVSRSATRPIR